MLGRFDEALEAAASALRIDPTQSEFKYIHSITRNALGYRVSDVGNLAHALALSPDFRDERIRSFIRAHA
jgi:hypothetical protein